MHWLTLSQLSILFAGSILIFSKWNSVTNTLPTYVAALDSAPISGWRPLVGNWTRIWRGIVETIGDALDVWCTRTRNRSPADPAHGASARMDEIRGCPPEVCILLGPSWNFGMLFRLERHVQCVREFWISSLRRPSASRFSGREVWLRHLPSCNGGRGHPRCYGRWASSVL